MRFRKRNCVVEAVQWHQPGDHPAVEWQNAGWCMATPDGWRKVLPGDWIVTGCDGSLYPMRNELFCNLYEPVANGVAG